MSENCLVTKLKASVVNENLPFLGEFRVKFYHSDSVVTNANRLTVGVTKSQTVKVVKGSGTFTVNNDSTPRTSYDVVVPEGSSGLSVTIYGSNDDFEIVFTDKYHIKSVSATGYDGFRNLNKTFGVDLSQVNYSIIETVLIYKNRDTDSVIDVSSGSQLIGEQCAPFNIDTLPGKISLVTTLSVASTYTSSKGNIVSLGDGVNLTSFDAAVQKGIYGEVNELAAALVASGKTSGTLILSLVESSCTDDGNPITFSYMQSKGGTSLIRLIFSGSGYTKEYA